MKKILIILCLLFLVNKLYSQTYPPNWVYEEVVIVDSTVKAADLHSLAKLFIATNFKSSKDVIQLDDATNQILLVKGNVTAKILVMGMIKEHGWVNFTFKIQSKDGKYKYTISDFYHDIVSSQQIAIGSLDKEKPGGGMATIGKKNFEELKKSVHLDISNLISNLKVGMAKKGNVKDNF